MEKIAGPASYNIQSFNSAKTVARMLVKGIYQFELKVTDDKGASAKDTVEVVVKDTYINSIRIDSLRQTGYYCVIDIPNLANTLPPGVTFDVYLRYYWGTGTFSYSGSFYKLDTIPDAQTYYLPPSSYWYWYEYSNGILTIHYPGNIDCNFDAGYHDVMIKW